MGIRVLLGGGGTGGHIYPALAVVERLRAVHPGAVVLFAATSSGLDRGILEAAGHATVTLSAGPVSGGSIVRTVTGLARQPLWIAEARRAVRRFRPDVV